MLAWTSWSEAKVYGKANADQDVQANIKFVVQNINQTENDMKMWQERNRRQTSSPSEIPAEYYKQAKVYGKANVGN